nr:5-formyltetrahydrofolate cyclo-ligase [Thioalkalivibrio sp. XN8]
MRLELRLRRRSLRGSRRVLATRAIVAQLRRLPAFRAARSIALYWPADGEPDLRTLAPAARARGKRLYLPVVGHRGVMSFAPWDEPASLRCNRYGIPEPVGRRRLQATQLDLVILPLVAFDARCHRLGMGGGYYDRALQRRGRRPVLIGAAFALQEVPAVPQQPWDVPLDLVVTERGRRKKGARA